MITELDIDIENNSNNKRVKKSIQFDQSKFLLKISARDKRGRSDFFKELLEDHDMETSRNTINEIVNISTKWEYSQLKLKKRNVFSIKYSGMKFVLDYFNKHSKSGLSGGEILNKLRNITH